MTADQAGDSKPPRYVGTIGHVSSRKSLMTAAIMKLLAEAGTKQEVPVMAEEQDEKPTAWKSMGSAPKDGRQILVRYKISTERVMTLLVRYRPQNGWFDGEWNYKTRDLLAWTDIPS